jgi:AcrR family transcriptional regulator
VSVAQFQRARVLAALYEVCAERGVGGLTVAAVVARAGVSRRTFYQQFASVEECLLSGLQQALTRASERVQSTLEPWQPWRVRMRTGLAALLAFGDEQPLLARLLLVDSLAAGPQALELREHALAPVLAAVAAGAGEDGARGQPPPLAAEGAVGGVLAVLHARVAASAAAGPAFAPGSPAFAPGGVAFAPEGPASAPRRAFVAQPPLLALLGQLMSVLVLPYLGPDAAAAELDAPAPAPAGPSGRVALAPSDPLHGLDMRLTYRTMRVLAAVAAAPGRSNRAIGRVAGVEDQGQMSKLLHRLSGLGLIENEAAGAPAGVANAWRITPRGRQLSDAFAG